MHWQQKLPAAVAEEAHDFVARLEGALRHRAVGATLTGFKEPRLSQSNQMDSPVTSFFLLLATPRLVSEGMGDREGGEGVGIHVGPAFTRGAKENGWDAANAADFSLRGATYLKDKVKTKSEGSAFRLAGVSAGGPKSHGRDWRACGGGGEAPRTRVSLRRARKDLPSSHTPRGATRAS